MNRLFGSLAAASCVATTLVCASPFANAVGSTNLRVKWEGDTLTYHAISRTIETSDIGTEVRIKVSSPDMDKMKMQCDALHIGAPMGSFNLMPEIERDWYTSGCWDGAAELTAPITAGMVGQTISMTGTAKAQSGVSSAALVTTISFGSKVDPSITTKVTKPVTDTTVKINYKTSLYQGVGAHIQLRVNGVGYSTDDVTSTSFTDLALKLPIVVKSTDKVEVLFDNDASGNGEDRNFWIDHITLPGGSVLNSSNAVIDAGGDWVSSSDGRGTSTGRALWSNGAMRWNSGVSASTQTPTTTPTPTSSTLKPRSQIAALTKPMYWSTGTDAYWAGKRSNDPQQKLVAYNIARSPSFNWFDGVNGGMDGDVARFKGMLDKANSQGQVFQSTLYGIMNRDCGSFSRGGQASLSDYKTWIDKLSATTGNSPMITVLEPDAVNYCRWDTSDQRYKDRSAALTYAAKTFHDKNPNVVMYLHMGSGQLGQDSAAKVAIDSGIQYMRGFALNVAGLNSTANNQSWGEQFVKTLQAKGIDEKAYVVDTGRNGAKIKSDSNPGLVPGGFLSCNNPTAALGTRPTFTTTAPHADAYLWVKLAGNSDGDCHVGDLPAGQWMWDYATTLFNNSVKLGTTQVIQPPANYHM